MDQVEITTTFQLDDVHSKSVTTRHSTHRNPDMVAIREAHQSAIQEIFDDEELEGAYESESEEVIETQLGNGPVDQVDQVDQVAAHPGPDSLPDAFNKAVRLKREAEARRADALSDGSDSGAN